MKNIALFQKEVNKKIKPWKIMRSRKAYHLTFQLMLCEPTYIKSQIHGTDEFVSLVNEKAKEIFNKAPDWNNTKAIFFFVEV